MVTLAASLLGGMALGASPWGVEESLQGSWAAVPSNMLGWSYFLAWSISFYVSFRTKSAGCHHIVQWLVEEQFAGWLSMVACLVWQHMACSWPPKRSTQAASCAMSHLQDMHKIMDAGWAVQCSSAKWCWA